MVFVNIYHVTDKRLQGRAGSFFIINPKIILILTSCIDSFIYPNTYLVNISIMLCNNN